MTRIAIKLSVLILVLVGGGFSACAEVKSAGRTVGHTTRDVTRDIGHASRDLAKELVQGTGRVVDEATQDQTK